MYSLSLMIGFIKEFLNHPLLYVPLVSLAISQITKTIIWSLRKKKFILEILYKGYGGFPSSHTATVTALTWSVWALEGFSNLFYVTAAMSTLWIVYVLDIKMFFDINTKFFNNLIELIEHPDVERMETVMGHTIVQVVAGFLLGIAVVAYFF